MWEIYDELIELLPTNLKIKDFTAGLNWFFLDTGSVGMAMTPKEGISKISLSGKVAGMQIRDAANLVKSWNNYEAALGLATINSFINSKGNVENWTGRTLAEQNRADIFDYMNEDKLAGKKVAVIGHFRRLERVSEICELSILERIPVMGDLPDPSCEYILPSQDVIFITGTTLINKTLPRLLQLSKNAYVILVGPSTPMAPCLYNYGVDVLSGAVVTKPKKLQRIIKEAGSGEFFHDCTEMINIFKKDFEN